jgi:hypothetical protein
MFSGALLDVLNGHARARHPWLSLADVGSETAGLIKERFEDDAVKPEVHTPDQRDGDVANVPLFPNLASSATSEPRVSVTAPRLSRANAKRFAAAWCIYLPALLAVLSMILGLLLSSMPANLAFILTGVVFATTTAIVQGYILRSYNEMLWKPWAWRSVFALAAAAISIRLVEQCYFERLTLFATAATAGALIGTIQARLLRHDHPVPWWPVLNAALWTVAAARYTLPGLGHGVLAYLIAPCAYLLPLASGALLARTLTRTKLAKPRTRTWYATALVAIVLLWSAALLFGSGSTASLGLPDAIGGGDVGGTVLSDGTEIPGVTISLTSGDTTQYAVTNASGRYSFFGVLPGRHQITAELSGFGTAARTVLVVAGTVTPVDAVLRFDKTPSDITVATGWVPVLLFVALLGLLAYPIRERFHDYRFSRRS